MRKRKLSIKRLTKHAKDKPMVETITQPTINDLEEFFSDEEIDYIIPKSTVTLDEIAKGINKWFEDKGLIDADPRVQFKKLQEEVDELGEAMAEGDIAHIEEELPDVIIPAFGLALQYGFDIKQLLYGGLKKIESREGKTIGDTFIKKSDLEKGNFKNASIVTDITPKKESGEK